MTDEGKEKKINIDFEPFKPINAQLYLCDNKVEHFIPCEFKRTSDAQILF